MNQKVELFSFNHPHKFTPGSMVKMAKMAVAVVAAEVVVVMNRMII